MRFWRCSAVAPTLIGRGFIPVIPGSASSKYVMFMSEGSRLPLHASVHCWIRLRRLMISSGRMKTGRL
jgi:hypothetical protein